MSVNQGVETLTTAKVNNTKGCEECGEDLRDDSQHNKVCMDCNAKDVTPAQQPLEDDGKGCERCGGEPVTHEAEGAQLCTSCYESISDEEEEDSYEGPPDADLNDGFAVIRGGSVGPRRPWAAKEPVSHKKRVLYQGEEDMFSLSDSDERDSIDDDAPDLLGYLGDFPGLTGVTKISMLRAAANYLSSQQRAAKPFQSPSVPASNNKKAPPAPKKKAKTFITKKRVPYQGKQ